MLLGWASDCGGWGVFAGLSCFLLCFLAVMPVAERADHVYGRYLSWCPTCPVCSFEFCCFRASAAVTKLGGALVSVTVETVAAYPVGHMLDSVTPCHYKSW